MLQPVILVAGAIIMSGQVFAVQILEAAFSRNGTDIDCGRSSIPP